MITLQNNQLRIGIDPVGAELRSAFHQQQQMEYLWQANPEFWGRTSPILFPIVGRLTDHTYYLNGQAYSLPQHGFARDLLFRCLSHSAHQVTFQLSDDENTQQQYPFQFVLTVTYTLLDDQLTVAWQVDNPNEQPLLFSIGAHPAFSTQLQANDQFEDYDISFDRHDQFYVWQLNDRGQLVPDAVAFEQPLQQFALAYPYFAIDALVFAGQHIHEITLKNRQHQHGVTVNFAGFPDVALWTADGKNKRSPFLCIEPWYGHADTVGGPYELSEKRGILSLAAGATFNTQYSIRFF